MKIDLANEPHLLKHTRKRKKLTQERMAEIMHIPQSTISKIENGLMELGSKDFFKWMRKTDSQDILLALSLNIDLTAATDLISNLANSGLLGIILGGLL
ncbi:helix-turn-helix domain-containing protein [Paraliobacillus ryukyuensis]|uniref:helix-turn-helix domain-containing protein n=1 Tax=Paraliobacillus ryukyuensis TaxID=200904 RepID=UPI0009A6DAF0|nr:helix-turn-helix transcriptional regulator [Paraliobacillus ryukyuensis]